MNDYKNGEVKIRIVEFFVSFDLKDGKLFRAGKNVFRNAGSVGHKKEGIYSLEDLAKFWTTEIYCDEISKVGNKIKFGGSMYLDDCSTRTNNVEVKIENDLTVHIHEL